MKSTGEVMSHGTAFLKKLCIRHLPVPICCFQNADASCSRLKDKDKNVDFLSRLRERFAKIGYRIFAAKAGEFLRQTGLHATHRV